MLTLGIETSCDETSCAVLENRDRVLSNVISSSLFQHRPFGGVVPEIASRHSLEQIDVVYEEAMREAGATAKNLGLVAVTYGPGLIGSLFVGLCFAKTLSYQLRIPFVGVNHLEAHLVANFIGHKQPDRYVGLLISGGHTSLSYHDTTTMKILGSTVDDAVGEAFDKVAKMLGLGYPGGPVIEKMARNGNPKAFSFTAPKQDNPFNFSFSGIKTAVLYLLQKKLNGASKVSQQKAQGRSTSGDSQPKEIPAELVCDVARCFQDAVVEWLIEKTLYAAQEKKVSDVVVGGGVSANGYLREQLIARGNEKGIKVWFPERKLSLDNAAMIARRGIELFDAGERSALTLTAVPSLKMQAEQFRRIRK